MLATRGCWSLSVDEAKAEQQQLHPSSITSHTVDTRCCRVVNICSLPNGQQGSTPLDAKRLYLCIRWQANKPVSDVSDYLSKRGSDECRSECKYFQGIFSSIVWCWSTFSLWKKTEEEVACSWENFTLWSKISFRTCHWGVSCQIYPAHFNLFSKYDHF